jgi:cell division protein FtsN
MNENKNYLKFLKLALYVVVIFLVISILWKSKTFFDKNYSKHEILESDSNLYKVENAGQIQDADQGNIQIIEQQPVEIHPEVTNVVVDANQNIDVTNSVQVQPATTTPAAPIAPAAPNATPEPKKEQPVKPKKIDKKDDKKPSNKEQTAKTVKPQTLAKPVPLAESVAKNPLFQSYVVQVGAFSNVDEAKKYQAKIATMQSVSNFRSDITSKNNIHKVFIGYFENHNSAENLCITLKKDNVQCFVTKL